MQIVTGYGKGRAAWRGSESRVRAVVVHFLHNLTMGPRLRLEEQPGLVTVQTTRLRSVFLSLREQGLTRLDPQTFASCFVSANEVDYDLRPFNTEPPQGASNARKRTRITFGGFQEGEDMWQVRS